MNIGFHDVRGPGPHTWSPSTFGILYGRTTQTACGKRILTDLLTTWDLTTCDACADVVAEERRIWEEMRVAALEIAKDAGYDSIEDYLQAHPRPARRRR